MILLDDHQPIPDAYTPGGMYRVRVGTDERLVDQARTLWGFARRALRDPLELALDPLAEPDIPPLADLESTRPAQTGCTRSTLTLFSSGTTGTPKPLQHDLASVMQRKRAGETGARWLLTYAPWRWAGLSVMLHVLKSQAILIVPDGLGPETLVRAAEQAGATHVSLTPSFLRRMELTCGEQALRTLPLQQVTFGGEAATQPVLDTAGRLWPTARISHVYASTEAGDVCAVSDGKAGIPQSKLTGERFGFTEDGELTIDGRATGDLWELRDGRYLFLGRRQEMINVGGAKVSPYEVESAALAIAGIIECRAYAVPSPLLGQVVALDYRGEADEKTALRTLREKLPKIAWPAQINRVDTIAMTDAGKTQRIERQNP